jgi:hypothetical protein
MHAELYELSVRHYARALAEIRENGYSVGTAIIFASRDLRNVANLSDDEMGAIAGQTRDRLNLNII